MGFRSQDPKLFETRSTIPVPNLTGEQFQQLTPAPPPNIPQGQGPLLPPDQMPQDPVVEEEVAKEAIAEEVADQKQAEIKSKPVTEMTEDERADMALDETQFDVVSTAIQEILRERSKGKLTSADQAIVGVSAKMAEDRRLLLEAKQKRLDAIAQFQNSMAGFAPFLGAMAGSTGNVIDVFPEGMQEEAATLQDEIDTLSGVGKKQFKLFTDIMEDTSRQDLEFKRLKAISSGQRKDLNLAVKQQDLFHKAKKKFVEKFNATKTQLLGASQAIKLGGVIDVSPVKALIARAVSGEKGVLTDKDVRRAFPATLEMSLAEMKTWLKSTLADAEVNAQINPALLKPFRRMLEYAQVRNFRNMHSNVESSANDVKLSFAADFVPGLRDRIDASVGMEMQKGADGLPNYSRILELEKDLGESVLPDSLKKIAYPNSFKRGADMNDPSNMKIGETRMIDGQKVKRVSEDQLEIIEE